MMQNKLLLFLLLILVTKADAQTNTYDVVYNIFQNKCTSCHGGSSPDGLLDLSLPSATVYSNIINKTPINPTASERGDKLIFPGDGHRSFLLRKCQNGLDPDNGLQSDEGNAMPKEETPLTNVEIEAIRQWILYGAKQTGVAVDTAVISKYYSGKGINYKTVLAPPPAGQGFQVHYGPMMLAPKKEIENFIKYNPMLPSNLEVNRVDLAMNKHTSHHFLMYKFLNGEEKNFADGLRPVTSRSNGELVSAWQTSFNTVLPAKTAFRWEKNTILDLNLHCVNKNADSVMMTDIRFNVYTQPYGTAEQVMYTEMSQNLSLVVPNTNTNVTVSKGFTYPQNSNMFIWTLSSHTHKYGVDFDIFTSTAGGGKDVQIFEGFYDFNYKFNQGYYSWEEPPVKRFTPFLSINPNYGLVMEATYRNDGAKTVTFGLTTNDEMMLMFIQYTKSLPTGINDAEKESSSLSMYPNPTGGSTKVMYEVKQNSQVKLELYNLLGGKVFKLLDQVQEAGQQSYTVDAKALGCTAGIYIMKLNVGGVSSARKLVVTE